MKKFIGIILIAGWSAQGCMAWPGLTALLGILGGKSGSAPFLFLPPGGGSSGGGSPDRENPPDSDLDPGNKDPVTLTRLEISPVGIITPRGTLVDFQATAIYSNNANTDVTDLISWESDDTSILEPDSNQELHPGRFYAREIGSTRVRSSFQDQSASVEVTVTAPRLVRIEVFPKNLSIIRGMSSDFSITGVFTDGTTSDLTGHSSNSFSQSTVIASPNLPEEGKIRGIQVGTATLTITHTTSYGVFTDSANISVIAPQLLSISISPSNPNDLALGLNQDFMATGNYENGESLDITSDVQWTVSDNAIGRFYDPPVPRGRFSGLSMGTTTITASSGVIQSDSVSITVIQKQLTGISISPVNASSPKGIPVQFVATGTFTDGSNENITNTVTWASSVPSIATISNGSGSNGRAIGATQGSTSITASCSTFSASTNLSITPAILQSLSIVPGTSQTVAGEFRNFTAIGTMSNGSTVDYTSSVIWSVEEPDLGTIANSPSVPGRFQGLSEGTATIRVDYPNSVSPTVTASTPATVLAADTTPPTIISASSISPSQLEVRFDKPMNFTHATNTANYKIVLSSALAGRSCSDNTNFTAPASAIPIASIAGSGQIFTLTLGAEQTFGVNYSVVGNRTQLRDQASTPNLLGCPNSANFEGNALLQVSSASCQGLSRIVVTFSKPVQLGTNPGSAECNSSSECAGKYRLDSILGEITDAKALDGTVCGGLPASNSRVCITHSLLQSGANYNLTAANGLTGDGFNDAGAILDLDGNPLQANPRDRAGFTGCGIVPNNFVDGPISSDTFGDGTSFGYLTNYNNRIYVGPNALGNSAARFNFDGSSPLNVGFLIERNSSGTNNHRNTATTRDGGISVPPFVTIGHLGCMVNIAKLSTGCGPDNENGRGTFAKVELFDQEFLFMGGARSVPGVKFPHFRYIYYTMDTGSSLSFNWIQLGNLTGTSTEGSQSFAYLNNTLYAGFAKLNEPNTCTGMPSPCGDLSRNTPDFSRIQFRNTASGTGCRIGQNCNAQSEGGSRFRIDSIDFFGGTNDNSTAGIATDNWGRYVGIDSLFVYRDRIYGANGGHHKVNHNGSIIRSGSNNPGSCTPGSNTCGTNWVEIGPRFHPFWHGSGANANRWFSLELRKASDFSPGDHAFAQFAEYKGNLYLTRTICQVNESSAATHAATFSLPNVPGCNDGSYHNRRPQLWKCIPETTGDANTCEAGDWSVVADDSTGITNFGYSGNHSATLLVTNGNYLYYGMDNEDGIQVWRTNLANPGSSSSSWELVHTNGFGDPNMRNIFSAISVPVGSQRFIYVSVGRNGTPIKIFRQQNN